MVRFFPAIIRAFSLVAERYSSSARTARVRTDKVIYCGALLMLVMHSYYLQRGGDNETIKAFPPGLRMLTGDPFARNNSGSIESQAINWNW